MTVIPIVLCLLFLVYMVCSLISNRNQLKQMFQMISIMQDEWLDKIERKIKNVRDDENKN